MGKHILAALLGGLLVVGVSPALAEDPQLTDQEVLQAWSQSQTEVKDTVNASTPEPTRGLKPLTDEELQNIVGGMAPNFPSIALLNISPEGRNALNNHYPGCVSACPVPGPGPVPVP